MATEPKDPVHPISGNYSNTGINIREYFAALAMQSLIINYADVPELLDPAPNFIAPKAVEFADALINALNNNLNKKNESI